MLQIQFWFYGLSVILTENLHGLWIEVDAVGVMLNKSENSEYLVI